MSKITIFGGSGFIGSHTADKLSEAGYSVTIYDKKIRMAETDQKMVVGDILDFDNISKVVKDSNFVINFAAISDLNFALKEPTETVKVNILGNLNILEASRIHNVSRFIYASTVYVHSKEGGFYRCSKQAAESYVKEYQKLYGLDYTILRFGSLYGLRSDDSNGIKKIIKSALLTGKIRYEGDKDAMREYIHVDDVASAALNSLKKEFKNESLILTGQEPMLVLDMLKMLAEILGIPNEKVEFIPGKYLGHYVRTPYSYKEKIGKKYIPPLHVDLGQGLLELIENMKNENK